MEIIYTEEIFNICKMYGCTINIEFWPWDETFNDLHLYSRPKLSVKVGKKSVLTGKWCFARKYIPDYILEDISPDRFIYEIKDLISNVESELIREARDMEEKDNNA